MRLIDADKLMEDIIKICKCQPYLEGMQSEIVYIQDVVDEQPTAFDVDKVCRKLNEYKDMDNLVDVDCVIEIVKVGGIDENRNI